MREPKTAEEEQTYLLALQRATARLNRLLGLAAPKTVIATVANTVLRRLDAYCGVQMAEQRLGMHRGNHGLCPACGNPSVNPQDTLAGCKDHEQEWREMFPEEPEAGEES